MKLLLALALLGSTPATASPPSDTIYTDGFEYNSIPCPSVIVPPDGVPRARKVMGGVSYGVYPQQRLSVDLTEWDNIWGYNNTTATQPVAWPGVGGAAPVIGVLNTQYIAAHFRTTQLAHTIQFKHPSYIATPTNFPRQYLTMVVSQQCGDFTPTFSPTVGCVREAVPASDAALMFLKYTPNAPDSWCNLRPDTDYYVNIMFTYPTVLCRGGPNCLMGTVIYIN